VTVKAGITTRSNKARRGRENKSNAVSPATDAANQSKGHLKSVTLRAYSDHQAQLLENQRIVEFLPMVHKIAQRVVTYLKPPLSFEDLASAGTIGLVKAARSYDPSHQASFKTYAYIRIKGAILDELRGWSFIPSSPNKQINDVMQTVQEMTEQTGTAPSDTELAEKLGITVDKLYRTFKDARAQYFLSIDASGAGDECCALSKLLASARATTPDKQIEQTELIEKLTEAIQQLPRRLRQIILLYYRQQLTMKQIGRVLEITESRVSQLHASAIFNLSVKLRQWKDGR